MRLANGKTQQSQRQIGGSYGFGKFGYRHSRGVASPQTGSHGTASSASHIALPCQWLTTQINVRPWRELAARPASAASEERQQMPAFGAFERPVCVAHF